MSYGLKIFLAFLVALGTFAALYFGRGLLVEHALMVSIACGALGYSALRAAERLIAVYRRRGSGYSVDWESDDD